MKLSFRKTGGFMGVDFEKEIDINSFSDQEKELLNNIIKKATQGNSNQADQFQYELSIEGRTVSLSKNILQPEELQLIKKIENNLPS
jgi:hypothetical protein